MTYEDFNASNIVGIRLCSMELIWLDMQVLSKLVN